MDKIKSVADGIFQIKGTRSNIFLIVDTNLVLVDTGMPGDYEIILDSIKKIGRNPGELTHILITHAHMDHIGSLSKIKEATEAKVVANSNEVDFVGGKKKMWTMGRSGFGGKIFKAIMFFMETFVWKYEPVIVDISCKGGEVIDSCGGIEVISTPGHSLGSLSFYLKEKKALFVGDSLSTMPKLRMPLKAGCESHGEAINSVKKISEIPIDLCFVGHGDSVIGNASEKIKAILSESK